MSDLTIEEQQTDLKNKAILNNAIVLANVIELSTSVVINLAGTDMAETLNKQSVSRAVLSNLVANRIKEKVLA